MSKIVMTVCYIIDQNQTLLGLKKDRLGKGFYNGFGGHIEDGESIEQAAFREVEEECGLKPLCLEKKGIVLITHESSDLEVELHIFFCEIFSGEVKPSDEMEPKWFSLAQIPYDQMWPSDRHYLPLFLEGYKCLAHFYLDKSKRNILSHSIQRVDRLPEKFDFSILQK